MAVNEDYLEFLRERLAIIGQISFRKMFGGAGIYHQGFFFALVASDELYFKVDDTNRADYEALGIGPFKPFDDKPGTMSYYQVPVEVLEDDAELKPWAERAISCARTAAAKKKPKKKKK